MSVALRLQSKDLDASKIQIHRFRARERMSALFEIDLEVVVLAADTILIGDFAGASLTVELVADGGVVRSFHGLVAKVTEMPDRQRDRVGYELVVRPRMWFSTLVKTLDVNLNRSIPDVIAHKLGLIQLGVGDDYRLHLTDEYPQRQMIVQYQESDFDFLSRLCEKVGIFFFFEGDERDVLIFGDSTSAYVEIEPLAKVPYKGRGEPNAVFELQADQKLIPSVYVCRDYYDQSPALELQEQHEIDEGFGGGFVEYGGSVESPEEAKRYARVRAEEQLCHRIEYRGRSTLSEFAPGRRFDLVDHPRHSRSLVLLEVVHEASQVVADWGSGDEEAYNNRFVAIPTDVCYRPARTTPVPRVEGVVSGVVETAQGMLGRHAQIDEQGRYTVRFLFDTSAPGEQKASCPVRMMQPSAGPQYGMHLPLKPGVEVVIAFLQGDPDRPVILGAVPNPITPSPVDGSEASKSRIKTRSGIVIEFDDADRG
jgi:type VI secretion system secreted protein VgrG